MDKSNEISTKLCEKQDGKWVSIETYRMTHLHPRAVNRYYVTPLSLPPTLPEAMRCQILLFPLTTNSHKNAQKNATKMRKKVTWSE